MKFQKGRLFRVILGPPPEDVADAQLEVVCDGEHPRVVVHLHHALVAAQRAAGADLGRKEPQLVTFKIKILRSD